MVSILELLLLKYPEWVLIVDYENRSSHFRVTTWYEHPYNLMRILLAVNINNLLEMTLWSLFFPLGPVLSRYFIIWNFSFWLHRLCSFDQMSLEPWDVHYILHPVSSFHLNSVLWVCLKFLIQLTLSSPLFKVENMLSKCEFCSGYCDYSVWFKCKFDKSILKGIWSHSLVAFKEIKCYHCFASRYLVSVCAGQVQSMEIKRSQK